MFNKVVQALFLRSRTDREGAGQTQIDNRGLEEIALN
jgi:hypothetical protein